MTPSTFGCFYTPVQPSTHQGGIGSLPHEKGRANNLCSVSSLSLSSLSLYDRGGEQPPAGCCQQHDAATTTTTTTTTPSTSCSSLLSTSSDHNGLRRSSWGSMNSRKSYADLANLVPAHRVRQHTFDDMVLEEDNNSGTNSWGYFVDTPAPTDQDASSRPCW